MNEGESAETGENADENDEEGGGPAGMLLSIALLDLLLFGVALYAFSAGETAAGAGVLALALALTGVDVWLYRRGSF
jgi:hypothetical protein